MKKLSFIPVLLSIAILFAACGGEEKRPGDLPVQKKASVEKTFPALVATAGVAQTVEVEFRLEDFAGVSQYKKWIKNADAPMSANTYIELKGIAEGELVELKSISVSLASNGGTQFPFPTPTITANEKFTADRTNRVAFMQAVMDEVVNKGSSKVQLKYTPTTTMVNPNVIMSIQIDAEFFFN